MLSIKRYIENVYQTNSNVTLNVLLIILKSKFRNFYQYCGYLCILDYSFQETSNAIILQKLSFLNIFRDILVLIKPFKS